MLPLNAKPWNKNSCHIDLWLIILSKRVHVCINCEKIVKKKTKLPTGDVLKMLHFPIDSPKRNSIYFHMWQKSVADSHNWELDLSHVCHFYLKNDNHTAKYLMMDWLSVDSSFHLYFIHPGVYLHRFKQYLCVSSSPQDLDASTPATAMAQRHYVFWVV